MIFKYKVIWFNNVKNRQEAADVDDQYVALFIAKKKLADGMQNVIIQLFPEWGSDPDDATWPAIDANIENN